MTHSVESMCRRWLVVVALVAVGCSSDDDDSSATSAPTTSTETGSDPARQALDEVVGVAR